MNRNINFKTLDEKKKELANLKSEWEEMKEQEKKLKEKFYSSPFEKRAQIKRELKTLQEAIFEKRNCGSSIRIEIEREESLQNRANPVGNPTDPKKLANLLKSDLQDILTNDSRWREEGYNFDYMEIAKGEEIWVMHSKYNKEIEKAIENLSRHRHSEKDYANDIKPSDLDQEDYNEILSMVRQISELGKVKREQHQQNIENIKLNNPQVFGQSRCSTDRRNGQKKWENWHTFHGKRNGYNWEIYVPDNHIALTNVLFDDGWGTNSEVGKFFVVEGVAKPTTLRYWNVAKQKSEIISEAEAQRLIKQDKDNGRYYINYHTYVDLNDKIWIDHYQGDIKQELAKPVSGANKLVENYDHKNMSGGVITKQVEKDQQLDNEFLLKYFQENDIKEISLTPEGNLLIEYNSGETATITNDQANRQGLQKVISYYQKNNQTNLSQQDLINMSDTNSPTTSPKNNHALLISFGIGGVLIIGMVIGLWLKKNKVKKG